MVTLNIKFSSTDTKTAIYSLYTVIMAEVMLYEAYVGGVTNILVNFEGLVNKKP